MRERAVLARAWQISPREVAELSNAQVAVMWQLLEEEVRAAQEER